MPRQAWAGDDDDGTPVEVYVSFAAGPHASQKLKRGHEPETLPWHASKAEERVRKIMQWFARHAELNITFVTHDGRHELESEHEEAKNPVSQGLGERRERRIDRSRVFLACISDEYIDKVAKDPHFFRCASEFRHAAWTKPACILQIALEKSATRTQEWPSVMRMVLKGQALYTWPRDDQFDEAMMSLAESIRGAAKRSIEHDPLGPAALFGSTHTFDALAEVRRKALEYLPGSRLELLENLSSWAKSRDTGNRVLVLLAPPESGKTVACAALCMQKGVCRFASGLPVSNVNGSSRGGGGNMSMSLTSTSSGSSRSLAALGDAGPRLSRLMSRKFSRSPSWCLGAVHFFKLGDAQARDVRICLRSVAHQLCGVLSGFREQLPPNLEWIDDPEALFMSAIADPCCRIQAPAERVVVLLDGINEADAAHRDILMRLIVNAWTRSTPSWLHLMVSMQTPGPLTRNSLERAGHHIIEVAEGFTFAEAKKYFGHLLAPFVSNKSEVDAVLPMLQLHGASSYLFGEIFENRLYASFPEGGVPVSVIMSSIPLGLDGLLRDSYESLLQGPFEGKLNAMHALLSVLCAARDPLPVEYILLLISSAEAKRLLTFPTRILVQEGTALRFVHSFVPEFLVDPSRIGNADAVDVDEGHRRLAHICGLIGDEFAAKHALYHLARAGLHDEALALLDDFSWVQRAIACEGPETTPAHRYERMGSLVQDCVSESLQKDSDAAQLMRKAMPMLSQNADELAAQIIARLPGTHPLRKSMTSLPEGDWLRPMRRSLEHPRGPLLEIFETGSQSILCVTMEDDRAFAGCVDGSIWVWQVNSGRLLSIWSGHQGPVTSIAVGNRLLLSGSEDTSVRAWDLASGRPIYVLGGHLAPVRSVVVGQGIIASGSDDTTVRVWSAISFEPIFVLVGHRAPVSSLSLSESHLVSGAWDLSVRVWNVETGRETGLLMGHEGPVLSVAVQDELVVSVSSDGSLRAWDVHTGRELYRVPTRANCVALCDGRIFAAGDRGLVQVWDAGSGTHVRDMVGHGGAVTGLFPLDGRVILSGSTDGSVRVWDAHATAAGAIQEHEGPVRCLALDESHAVSGGEDGTIRLWDATMAVELDVLVAPQAAPGILAPVSALALYGSFAAAATGPLVSLWNVGTGERMHVMVGHIAAVNKLVFAQAGDLVVSASNDRTVRVWELQSGREILSLARHRGPVTSMAVSGNTLVSGSDDASVYVWDLETGRAKYVVEHPERVRSVAFACGLLVAGLFDGSVHVWNADTGRSMVVLRGHVAPVVDIEIEHKGSLVTSRDCLGRVLHWDIPGGKEISFARADTRARNSASFAGGRLLLGEGCTGFSIDVPFTCAERCGTLVAAGDRNGVLHFLELNEAKLRPLSQRRP